MIIKDLRIKQSKKDFDLDALKKKLLEQLELAEKKLHQTLLYQKILKNVIAKLENTEKSLEIDLCCQKCLELLDDPLTIIPCGHTFCLKCVGEDQEECPKCNMDVDFSFKNQLLTVIVSKTSYR